VARRLGLGLIVGTTNVRNVMDCLWPDAYQGAAMGGTGLALAGMLGDVLIPSSFTYKELGLAWGSHPLLDECWSTESVSFTHDGCESYRFEKIRDIAEWDPAALDELRVCLKVAGAPTNCGKCYKCTRTMLVLSVLGRAEVKSFPAELPRDYLKQVMADYEPNRAELQLLLERVGAPPELRHLPGRLRRFERRRHWRRALRSVAQLTGVLPPLKAARDAITRVRAAS
jgi:bacterioferritin-associated ferredoxin